MDKSLTWIKISITLLTVLVLINLVFTFVIYDHTCNRNTMSGEMSTGQFLPDVIESEKHSIVNTLIGYWNSQDVNGLYQSLGDVAKGLVSFEEFEKQNVELQFMGNIKNPRFVHFRNEGKLQGCDAYDLIYSAEVGDKSGGLTVSVIAVDNGFEILGFNISTNYIAPD